jgi:phosphate transport system protein
MQRHFEKELESLQTTLIKMGSAAEDAMRMSVAALLERSASKAQTVIDGDERINSLEMEIDNAIVDILALQQPVAVDLRMILAAQKINNDLERIGDHAVNIAESALTLAGRQQQDALLELPKMAEIVLEMVRDALDGFIHREVSLGTKVLEQDDVIDEMNKSMTRQVIQLMKTDQKSIEAGLDLIRVSRNLERVADLATNIAEEVIFIAQARIVKHHAADFPPRTP